MTFAKMLLAGLCLMSTTAVAQSTAPASCLRLVGQVIDYTSHSPISDAKLFVKLPGSRKLIGNSDASGFFSVDVPCATMSLIFEHSGFRPQSLPLHRLTSAKTDKIKSVATLIPLLPVDRQDHDRPYLQTEQTDYVQKVSHTQAEQGSAKAFQQGTFAITDAIDGTPLSAKACFFFTQTGARKCVDVTAQGQFNFDFRQVDIVAMEISSPGYQTYVGNIRIEELDGRSLRHEVRLLRDLTLFSVFVPEAVQPALRVAGKIIPLKAIPNQPGWFVAYDLLPKSYDLMLTEKGRIKKEDVTLTSGLNYKIVTNPTQLPAAIATSSTSPQNNVESISATSAALLSPDELKQVYFEQSSYVLRADSQTLLRQIAAYLKSNPDYKARITGYTDNVGLEQLNQHLSDYRARVTANFLSRQGIAGDRLIAVGKGSQNPIAPNDTDENRALNRRVSLQITVNQ